MRILRWIVGLIVLLGIVFVGGGYLLPRDVSVARSIEIDAAPEAVFAQVNSLKAGQEWSPWAERDPDMKIEYSGPDTGVGAAMSWTSEQPDVGIGSQVITVSDPNERVETDLDFGQMGTAKAAFILDGAGDRTELTWTLLSDMGDGPVGRWMGLMMDDWVGADYEVGLSNLKALVEQ